MFGLSTAVTIAIVVGGAVVAFMMIGSFIANLYRKAGPNEALIVYGFGGTKVIKGRGKVIFPMVQNYKSLSLELM
jgi:flotillin